MERMPVPEPADRPMGILPAPNPDRVLHATLDGTVYARFPVRTHLVTDADDASEVVRRFATPLPEATVLVAVSERMVAITEGRSYPMTSIRPGRLARFLVRFVTRPGYGIGLGTAETMQLAISEVGAPRILLAAVVSGLTKPFGVHGLFYRIAGRQAAAIDGPTSYTIAPYNQAATLGPTDPDRAAREISAAISVPVAVIDANDAGCNALGVTAGLDRRFVERLFADNPLGQAGEQTPICVVRRVDWPEGERLPAEPRRRLSPP